MRICMRYTISCTVLNNKIKFFDLKNPSCDSRPIIQSQSSGPSVNVKDNIATNNKKPDLTPYRTGKDNAVNDDKYNDENDDYNDVNDDYSEDDDNDDYNDDNENDDYEDDDDDAENQ
ncbi:calsequestrin-2-like [Drosophila willistoni]|uniref:calsequestrin-2-like n=1 Tax=Drosophila willistoni TaxID=7260 RepID=UPI001F087339|nr:calsequestrin-2-like [Drosophila willistoni]